ncbi:hypothetical protein V6N13_092521 [Hibiscus sabdariffa]|uniref:Cystatin domain-containing protein n=1 Tax=Hibiscus sabdariffa TaxID=183260 RepID=A0ABR2CEJ0_9ROSI
MQQHPRFPVILLSLLFLPLIFSDAEDATSAGGWVPIKNVTELYVTDIAEFAVHEYNSQLKRNLWLEKVIRGETQLVDDGENYRLVLKTNDGPVWSARTSTTYQAVVFVNGKWEPSFKNLTSFYPFLG